MAHPRVVCQIDQVGRAGPDPGSGDLGKHRLVADDDPGRPDRRGQQRVGHARGELADPGEASAEKVETPNGKVLGKGKQVLLVVTCEDASFG